MEEENPVTREILHTLEEPDVASIQHQIVDAARERARAYRLAIIAMRIYVNKSERQPNIYDRLQPKQHKEGQRV